MWSNMSSPSLVFIELFCLKSLSIFFVTLNYIDLIFIPLKFLNLLLSPTGSNHTVNALSIFFNLSSKSNRRTPLLFAKIDLVVFRITCLLFSMAKAQKDYRYFLFLILFQLIFFLHITVFPTIGWRW